MTKTYDQTPQIDFQVKTKAELEAYSSELSRQFVAINTDGRLHWIDQDGEYHITSQKANVTTVDPTAGDDVDDGYYPLSMWINQTDDKAFICLDSTVGAAVWLEIKDIGSAILGTDFGTNSILKRDIASTPVSLGIEENRLIGRPSGGVISSLTGAQAASIIDAFVKSTDTASDIKMTSGGHSVKDAFDDYLGHGWSAGHTGFQDNGDGTITIDAGEGYLRSTQDSSGAIDKYDVPGDTLTLTDNATNWIYQSYNGGSPVLAVSSNPTSVRGRQDINIIKVVDREGTDLRPVSADNGWKSFHSIVSQKFFDEATARGYRSSYPISGAQIATKGTRNLYISSGIFWGGPFRSESDEIDTSAGDTATQWYGNTSVGFTSASITQTNNTQYFNGTALASLTVNQYTIRWEWLLSSGDQLHQMIGTGQYVSEELAREAAVTKPSDIPPRLARFGTFVGAKIVRQGSDTIIDLPYVTSDFSGSGVPAHDATLDKDSNPLFQHITQTIKTSITDFVNRTMSQTTFYVASTGSDTTGDGTVGSPYATVEKCFTKIPHVIPEGISVLIKVANGTYNSFPTCIDNDIPNGQILIDGYEGDVDVLAGPYTISSISKEEVGSTFTVSGASFTNDGLRDADNNPVYIKMLTGTYTGNTYAIHKNGTDWITVIDKNLGLADGDTFKIVRPGVRVVTSSEIVIAPKCDRGFASVGMYNISFISSYEPDALNNAAVKVAGGNVCMHLVTIRSDAEKSYALAVNSTSINGEGLFDDTKLSYYSAVTGTKFDPFYFGFCFHANAMSGASFKAGVSVAITPGGKSAGGNYGTTTVYGICTRTEVTVHGESVSLYFNALGRVHVQQGSTRADIRACIMSPFGDYAVLVSDNTVAVCAYLKMIHTTALGQLFKVEDGSVLNDLTSIATDTGEDYVVSVGANCQLNLLAVPSITGDVDDIYFERGQIAKSWPDVGKSVNDSENSYVAVAGSATWLEGSKRDGDYYRYVAAYQQDLAVSETISGANPVGPDFFISGEAASMHIMLSGTVRGTNEAVMFSGYDIAALDGEKINNLTKVHDSITGQYGITSITSIVGTPRTVGATVQATGGITDAITIDWRLFVQGAVHQGVGAWC